MICVTVKAQQETKNDAAAALRVTGLVGVLTHSMHGMLLASEANSLLQRKFSNTRREVLAEQASVVRPHSFAPLKTAPLMVARDAGHPVLAVLCRDV